MSVQIKTGRKYKVAASIPERPGARVVQQGPPGPPGPPGQDSTVPGPPGAAGGFGTPTASATELAEGQPPTVAITDSGPDTAKIFDFEFGIPAGATGQTGETGPAGADGAAAGFDAPSASASGLAAGASPTADVVASGPDTAKQFDFSFGIPAGAPGSQGPAGPAGPPGQDSTVPGPQGDPGPPAFVGSSAPPNPDPGWVWFDSTTTPATMRFWNGSAWQVAQASYTIPDPLTLGQFVATNRITTPVIYPPASQAFLQVQVPSGVNAGRFHIRYNTDAAPQSEGDFQFRFVPGVLSRVRNGAWEQIAPAPPAPVTTGPPAAPGTSAGQMVADTTGGIWVWDGNYWRPVGGQHYYAHVTQTVTQQIPGTGAWTAVNWDHVVSDPHNSMSSTGNRYIPPIPGRYSVFATVQVAPASNAYIRANAIGEGVTETIAGVRAVAPSTPLETFQVFGTFLVMGLTEPLYINIEMSANAAVNTNPITDGRVAAQFAYVGPV